MSCIINATKIKQIPNTILLQNHGSQRQISYDSKGYLYANFQGVILMLAGWILRLGIYNTRIIYRETKNETVSKQSQ